VKQMGEGRVRCCFYRATAGAPCTRSVHRRRRRAAARDWGSEAVLLRACKAVPRFGGTRASRCATERKGCDGACQQPRGEVTRQLGVASQGRWVRGVRRGRVSETLWSRARPEDMFRATEEGRWGGRRGRVRQTCATAIGGCQRGSARGRSREACRRGQEGRESAGSRAGHLGAAKRGGEGEISMIWCGFPRW
jgi:hypothetical protein